MSKDFPIKENVYLVLLQYFDGKIENINKKTLKELNDKKFKGKEIDPIDKKAMTIIKKILKIKEKDPKMYASTNWVYPDWSEEEKLNKLKEAFPDDYPDEEEGDEEEELIEIREEEIESASYETILPQRKEFINWVNNVFYKGLIEEFKRNPITSRINEELKSVNIYQMFVKEYLSIETPFRGLLVYHGLGTGKTATSVITSEGLSKNMKITTLLPASLETEYIKEVKSWGNKLFKVGENNWIFYPIKELNDNKKLREEIREKYDIPDIKKLVNKIFNESKNSLFKKLDNKSSDFETNKKAIVKNLDKLKGLYLPVEDLSKENREIYTITGRVIDGEYNGEVKEIDLEMKEFIEAEINNLIILKYKFIHYNGFPEVHKVDFKNLEALKTPEKEGTLTNNQKIVEDLKQKYLYNLEKHQIYSPFRNEVIIIDEVHNFVREIINESPQANIFYNWIMEAEDVKLIFLSATPLINKPAEIAILFNMLRGKLNVFNFTVTTDRDEEDIQKELRDKFYTEKSSIEQLHVKKQKGKMVVSFIKNKTNFESIMIDDVIKTVKHNDKSLKYFFDEIFEGIYEIFETKNIYPKKQDLNNTTVLNDIKLGKPKIFDEETGIVFNRKQRLFDIYENESILDVSLNDNFIEYFFDDMFNIPPNKQVLLRRMLMGLTSYYPIDRSSIVNMPTIVEPDNLTFYEDYSIVKKTNIIPCYMSSIQWTNYEYEYSKEKQKKIQQLRKKNLYNEDESSTYNIRTRQNCNVVYEDDSFRIEKDEDKKEEIYNLMMSNGGFSFDGNLKLYSPKFYEIMKNIEKFLDSEKNPTGKILYYSDFRHESGSEAFEKILVTNGYEKYNPAEKDINQLIESGSKKKRFSFLTGKESLQERLINKDHFNHEENLRGEYIQILLISSSGAEGISLKAVRQVHIMEPFWNYIRVDQVFGRAARMESHSSLPEEERNVEQYIYLSYLPEGNTVEDVFDSMKFLKWGDVDDIERTDDIKMKLVNNHKALYKSIQKIISIKKETKDRSIDQMLFDIMEKKNKISIKLTDIIREAAVDCIQNTRDDIELNEKCLRFSEKVKSEEAHFPGLTSKDLNVVDQRQYKATFSFHIKPDIHVISASKDGRDIFIYYQLERSDKDYDVRYIRENGIRLCEYEPFTNMFVVYSKGKNRLDEYLGNKFSVFQEIYSVPDYIYENKIKKELFPELEEIINEDYLYGNVIKYNVTEKLFFSPYKKPLNIIKLYDNNLYTKHNRSILMIKPILIRNKKIFKSID
tara:strand:+ start:1725 stop:5504 length:3780 start_codon:yes stop_codon:yes gene_type:complete